LRPNPLILTIIIVVFILWLVLAAVVAMLVAPILKDSLNGQTTTNHRKSREIGATNFPSRTAGQSHLN
jgi:hypothetical protein